MTVRRPPRRSDPRWVAVAALVAVLGAVGCGPGSGGLDTAQGKAAANTSNTAEPPESSTTANTKPDGGAIEASPTSTASVEVPTTRPTAAGRLPIAACPGRLQTGRRPVDEGRFGLGGVLDVVDAGAAGTWLVLDGGAGGLGPHPPLYRTKDGGNTWEALCVGEVEDSTATAVWPGGGGHQLSYIDDRHGWLVHGGIFRTDDAGETWTAGAVPRGMGTLFVDDFDFVDPTHGWAVGRDERDVRIRGVVWRTVDGGRHWNVVASSDTRILDHVSFADPLHGWATATDVVFSTSDGGRTWSERELVPTGSTEHFRLQVLASDRDHAWVLGYDIGTTANRLWATADGGATWTNTTLPPMTWPGLAGPDHSVVRVFGSGSVDGRPRAQVVVSSDAGATWELRYLGGKGVRVGTFSTALSGWYVADREWPLEACIYRTTDGGNTWAAFPLDGAPTDCQSV